MTCSSAADSSWTVLELAQVDHGNPGQLAGLPADQPRERRIRADDPAVAVEQGLADRGRFEGAVQQRLRTLQRPAARLELGEHRHLRPQQIGVEWLEQIVDRADPVSAGDLGHLVLRRGQEHDRDIPGARPLLDQLRRFEPVEPRHPDVEQDHREVLLEQHPQRSVAGCRGSERVPERLEHRLERAQILRLVVDEQDRQRLDLGEVQPGFPIGESGGWGWAGGTQSI